MQTIIEDYIDGHHMCIRTDSTYAVILLNTIPVFTRPLSDIKLLEHSYQNLKIALGFCSRTS